MKSYRFFLPLILFLFFNCPVFSQEAFSVLQERIVGQWQADIGSLKNKMEQGQKMVYENLPKQAKVEIDDAMASREFVFYKDGVFAANWKIGENAILVKGRWEVGEKGKLFIEVQGVKSEYLVFANGIDGMRLVPQRERRGLVHDLYFTKMEGK